MVAIKIKKIKVAEPEIIIKFKFAERNAARAKIIEVEISEILSP